MKSNRVSALALAIMLSGGAAVSTTVGAKEQCYDFSQLTVGTDWNIGQTVDARHATIAFRPYKMAGAQVGGAVNIAKAQQSKIAGGVPPEMDLKTITVQVTPKQPVTRLRVRLAQNMTPTGGFGTANFEVNGRLHEVTEGFAGIDGRVLGGAEFRASFSNPSANWHVGVLELRAHPGEEITSFSIGGHTWRMDDMCLDR